MAATEGLASLKRLSLACALGAGCSVQAPEGDGLFVQDAGAPFGFQTTQSPVGAGGSSAPTSGGDAPGAGGTALRTCANVAGFSAQATPLMIRDCVRCHDGTKGKATKLLDLTTVRDASPPAQQTACNNTLGTTNAQSPTESTIFTFVDPDNPSTTHDFKYVDGAEFAAFRDAVMVWLASE